MIHTQQNQESEINKPKNFIVNETNNKFVENTLNKSKQLQITNNQRTFTQSAIINTQMNNSILQTQQINQIKKDADNSKKLNVSANNVL